MADNIIYIPFLNPLRFYREDRADSPVYHTRHFDDWTYEERLKPWQQRAGYHQPWQTTDIINLQFESMFDPITVELIDKYGRVYISLPTITGLPNRFLANTFSYQAQMSLAGLDTGCYYVRISLSTGPSIIYLRSACLLISAEPLKDTILIEYWSNRAHGDVLFETGIKFQVRVAAQFGFLIPGGTRETYSDQRANPYVLNGRNFRSFELFIGYDYGLPDDMIDLITDIWSCQNVTIDGKPFAVLDIKDEFITVDRYPKRSMKLEVREGINRASRPFSITTDTNKKIASTIIVSPKVFGDTANQGSSNAVPVINVE